MQGPSILLPIPHHDAVHHPPGPHRPDRQPPRARHHDLRPADRGIRRPPDPRQGRRGRHQLPGHGRRLPAGRRLADDRRHRGNPGPLAARRARPARRFRRGDQGVRTDRSASLGPGLVAQAPAGRDRCLARAPADGLCRSLSDAWRRYAHAAGRDPGGPGHHRPLRPRPLCGGVQFPWRIAWPARWGRPSCTASCAWSRCSRATACCSARSSANCCRWRRKRAWA